MTRAYQELRPHGHPGRVIVADPASLAEADACSMVIVDPVRGAPELVAELTSAGFGPERVTLAYAGPRFVEVTAPTVDKASGVARALRRLGVPPERAIAFGDMPIDIAMFAVVGHSVAMSGAPFEVLAAADCRTEAVEDDGFARELARRGLIQGLGHLG